MRCDNVDSSAFCELPEGLAIQYYEPGMHEIWMDIQKSAGAFDNYNDADIMNYFSDRFLSKRDELERRCIFLKDIKKKIYVGTCCAWMAEKEGRMIPVLHWLAVRNGFENMKYARMLITETMKIFNILDYGESVYLHTQPSSYKAIKLYNDFGFCITKHDTYGNAKNECSEALEILKNYMEPVSFAKIIGSLIE
jgi:hypothetical protein